MIGQILGTAAENTGWLTGIAEYLSGRWGNFPINYAHTPAPPTKF